MLAFNVAFTANLLASLLRMQQIWGYSALTTGCAIAVGPLLVPVTAALTHRLLANVPQSRLVAAGSLVLGAGVVVLALSMQSHPDYPTAYLPGWLLGGVGVGLALPNLVAGGTRDLAPDKPATGSGIVAMSRQIGFVIGISILFAIVGDDQGIAAQDGLRATWWVSAGALVATSVLTLGMSAHTRRLVAA